MPKYYKTLAANANCELWREKPAGYYTVDEWRAANPPEPLPAPTPEETKARRMAEIKGQLAQIDMDSIRPLRAVADGTATDYDTAKLQELESQAAALRAELAGLET